MVVAELYYVACGVQVQVGDKYSSDVFDVCVLSNSRMGLGQFTD